MVAMLYPLSHRTWLLMELWLVHSNTPKCCKSKKQASQWYPQSTPPNGAALLQAKRDRFHLGAPVFLCFALEAKLPGQVLKARAKVCAAVHGIKAAMHFKLNAGIHAHDLQGHFQMLGIQQP